MPKPHAIKAQGRLCFGRPNKCDQCEAVHTGTESSTVPAGDRFMIYEGNGRYMPCDALYKTKQCMIDEGNGRYTPCQALLKQKKTPKKK